MDCDVSPVAMFKLVRPSILKRPSHLRVVLKALPSYLEKKRKSATSLIKIRPFTFLWVPSFKFLWEQSHLSGTDISLLQIDRTPSNCFNWSFVLLTALMLLRTELSGIDDWEWGWSQIWYFSKVEIENRDNIFVRLVEQRTVNTDLLVLVLLRRSSQFQITMEWKVLKPK